MGLEADLELFWDSYVPALKLVEDASATSDHSVLAGTVAEAEKKIVLKPGWSIERPAQGRWYDPLLIGKVVIPYSEKGRVLFHPEYREKDGKVYWNSFERNNSRFVSDSSHLDAMLDFDPQLLPAWKADPKSFSEGGHHHDWRQYKDAIGETTVMLEDASGAFISYERVRFNREDDKKPMYVVGPKGITIRAKPKPVLISVKLDYKHLDSGMTDDEMGAAMGAMYEGYTWVTRIQFCIGDLGQGEVDRFLQHLEIEY